MFELPVGWALSALEELTKDMREGPVMPMLKERRGPCWPQSDVQGQRSLEQPNMRVLPGEAWKIQMMCSRWDTMRVQVDLGNHHVHIVLQWLVPM